MRFLFLILTMAVSAFSAHGEDDYYPLHDGDEWTMSTIFSRDGTVTKDTFHKMIEGTQEVNGKIYLRMITRFGNGEVDRSQAPGLFRKDEKALYQLIQAGESVDIVLPLKVGGTWRRQRSANIITDTIIGLEDVRIDGIAYHKCYHMQTTSADGKFKEDTWYAPGIGPVKCHIVWANGDELTETLKEFKLGK